MNWSELLKSLEVSSLCLEMNCVLGDEHDVVCTGACAYRRIISLSAVGGHRALAHRARPPSGLQSIRGPGTGQQRGRSAERQRANGGAVGGAARARRKEWTQRIARVAGVQLWRTGGRPAERASSAGARGGVAVRA